jgi:hypothetical protein
MSERVAVAVGGMMTISPEAHEHNEIRNRLWNPGVTAASYASDAEFRYRGAILEQYKIYVEMADRVSNRRGLTNTFFLTLNTLIITLFGLFWKDRPPSAIPPLVLALPLILALGECVAWWMIVQSYRQLNTGKYKVVGLLEEQLPASPYWSAEWKALGEGKDIGKYLPLSHVEQWIPILFGVVYFLGFVLALIY